MTTSIRIIALVVGALVLHVALAMSSMREKNATFDEGVHVAAGYSHLAEGDYRLMIIHPPLARTVAAVPLLLARAAFDRNDESWRAAEQWHFAHRFFYRWNDAERLLFLARLPTLATSCLLALGIFFWINRRWGVTAAGASLFLYVLNPDVLAHARLATNDLPVACWFFFAIALFEISLARITWIRLVACGLALGAAVASKYTALALAPILTILALVAVVDRRSLVVDLSGLARRPVTLDTFRRRLVGTVAACVILVLLALVVLWAAYGFHADVSEDPAVRDLVVRRIGPAQGAPARIVAWLGEKRVIPATYALGFVDTLRRSQGRPAFLMGHTSQHGFWYYYPVAFVLKTPIALQILILISVLLGVGRQRAAWFVWLPIVFYGLACLITPVDLGVRFLLPIIPFLVVAAGVACTHLLPSRSGAMLAATLLAWSAASVASIHPHYLAYFNAFAGGPSQGYRMLVDSNLDWGQDLKGLARFVKDEKLGTITLSYFGTADPAYYGLQTEMLPGSTRPRFSDHWALHVFPGDVIAVSATNLQAPYMPRSLKPLMALLRARERFADIGHSIFLYRADFEWLVRPEDARDDGWLEDALRSYRQAARVHPENALAHGYRGAALEMMGKHRRSLAAFEEALRLDPGYFEREPTHRGLRDAAQRAAREKPPSLTDGA